MVGAGREAKRRRKTLGNDAPPSVSVPAPSRSPENELRLKYLTSSPFSETETGEKTAKEEAVVENTTPDYAAGLVSTQVPWFSNY